MRDQQLLKRRSKLLLLKEKFRDHFLKAFIDDRTMLVLYSVKKCV